MLRIGSALPNIAMLLLASVFMGRVLADSGPVDSPENPIAVNDEGGGNPAPPAGPGDADASPPQDPDAGPPSDPKPVPPLFKSVVNEQTLTVPGDISENSLYEDAEGPDVALSKGAYIQA
jgi:hypothetical protein